MKKLCSTAIVLGLGALLYGTHDSQKDFQSTEDSPTSVVRTPINHLVQEPFARAHARVTVLPRRTIKLEDILPQTYNSSDAQVRQEAREVQNYTEKGFYSPNFFTEEEQAYLRGSGIDADVANAVGLLRRAWGIRDPFGKMGYTMSFTPEQRSTILGAFETDAIYARRKNNPASQK